MTMRRFTRHTVHLVAAASILVSAACGDDDDAGDGAAEAEESAAAATDSNDSDSGTSDSGADASDGDSGGSGGVSMQSGTGAATVVLNGETWSFATVDGAISVCTEAFGTFQAALPQLDDAGNHVDGSELSLIALQPGIEDDEKRDVYVELVLSDGSAWVAGESGLAEILDVELEPIELRADGTSLNASVEVISLYGGGAPAVAEISVEC